MSDTTLNLISSNNEAAIHIDEFLQAMQPKRHEFEWNGSTITLKPITILELFALLRRFPKAKALVHTVADLAFGSDEEAAEAEQKLAGRTIIDIFLDVGDEVAAALVAIALGQPGNAAIEKALLSSDTEALIAIFVKVYEITLGGRNPADFFMSTLGQFEQMGIRRGGQKQTPKKPNKIAKPVQKAG